MLRNAAQLDSRTRVLTPENIAFEYRAAGPFTRLGAYLIDLGIQVLVVVVSIILFMIMFGLLVYSWSLGGTFSVWEMLANLGTFVIFVLWFLMQWFYGAFFEYRWNGQTPGKRSLGLRVLQSDGRPINSTQAILRNLLRLVDAMPLLPVPQLLIALLPAAAGSHLVALVAMSLTARHQRLGDLVCGTMVVAEDRSLVGKVERIDDAQIAKLLETIPANFTPSRTLSKALAHYVGRRRYFGPARRQEIARHVGAVLIDRLNLPADTDCDLLLGALYNRAFGGDMLPDDTPRAAPTPNDAFHPPPTGASPTSAPPTAVVAKQQGEDEPTDWESVPLG